MYALTFRLAASPSPATRMLLRDAAAMLPPPVRGLRGRHWRAGRRGIRGVYLFDEREALEEFARDPSADPARALFAPLGDPAAAVAEIAPPPVFDRPIFIITAPRAGGTLLYELLAQSAGLFSLDGESHGPIEGIPALHPAARGFESHGLTEADATPATMEALHAGFAATLRDHTGRSWLGMEDCPRRVRLLEKTPENALRIRFLAAAFPDARFVFLHRDARQNVSSLAEAWHHDGFVNIPRLPGWDRERWCFLLPRDWQSQNGRPISDVAAFQWRAANQEAMHDLDALPRDRWTAADYAELVTAPEPTVRRLCDFLEIEVDPALAAALRRPLPVSSTAIRPPSPVKWRSNPHFDPRSLAGLGPVEGRLRNLLVRPAQQQPPRPARLAEVRFACFLDDAGDAGAERPADAIVHPSLLLQSGATVPLPLVRRTRHRERFAADHPIAWIQDPASGVWSPFFARRAQLRALLQLRPGQAPPDAPEVRRIEPQLLAAGILTTAADVEARRREGEALTASARNSFGDDALCRLPALLHPLLVRALARYYRELIEAGWAFGDDQVERRHGWHNEPLCSFVHHQLTAFVSRIAGEAVKPAYSYASAYRGSAALPAHMDRRQCEYTMSLLVDHVSASSQEPWPLWFLGPHGRTQVDLEPGDAALFRGCELPHWRETAPADQDQITLLFHWVPASFDGVLD